MTSDTRPLLDIHDLAKFLGVSEWTLYEWRNRRQGPPAIKVGRLLRWRPSDVETWLDQRVERA